MSTIVFVPRKKKKNYVSLLAFYKAQDCIFFFLFSFFEFVHFQLPSMLLLFVII